MTRLPIPPLEAMTDAQKAVYDIVASGPRGIVRGPFAVWLHRPDLCRAAEALGKYARYDSTLPMRLSELAILVVARAWSAEFPWCAHKAHAVNAGVAAEIVEAIRIGAQPSFSAADEALVYDITTTLMRERNVPQELYERGAAELGTDRLVDLVGLIGYYTMVALTAQMFDLDLPEGAIPELTG